VVSIRGWARFAGLPEKSRPTPQSFLDNVRFLEDKIGVQPLITPLDVPQDLLAEALCDLRAAEVEFAFAHRDVNAYYELHPEYKPVKNVAGRVVVEARLPDAELTMLLQRENHAAADRARKMHRWSELEQQASREEKHVAGILVRRTEALWS
jgi:hypothetical protein